MYGFFKCPVCKEATSLPKCKCGYEVPYNQGIYQLTNDPYMVKDSNADVKYIGYEDIGEAYSGGKIFNLLCKDNRYKTISDLIGDGILLDLACGDGLYTVPLIMEGTNVISMDISDKMLSLLYKRADINGVDKTKLTICRANALDIPLTDSSVDAVLANSMLHLISKPELVIYEIYRVLKKNGKYITMQDKPSGSSVNENNLTEDETFENTKYNEFVGLIYRRYFEILKNYNIYATKYSWKFDREKICDDLFSGKETYTIPIDNKITDKLSDSFIYRLCGKGYSDQSDVPWEIHTAVFETVMSEFVDKFGDRALDTVYTGYENDCEVTVYIK
jgi:Methylase involved in ubiquinone/menaquinone biosynthesis